jgi:hypothetical protein
LNFPLLADHARVNFHKTDIPALEIWRFEKKCLPLHAIIKKCKDNIDIYEQKICRTQRLEFGADE